MCHPGWSVENKFSGSFYFIFVVSTYKCAADQRGPLKCSLTLPCFRTVVQCPPQTGLNELCFGQRFGTKNPATISFFCKNVFPLEAETTASSALEQKITLFIISLLSVTCRTHIEKGRQTVNSKKCFRKSIFVFKNGTSLVSFSFIFGLFT